MTKLGLKLWSTNIDNMSTSSIEACYRKGVFDYIELFVVPGSTKTCYDRWRKIDVPYILHAPHFGVGLNLSLPNCETHNSSLIEEVEYFFFTLNPKKVIFHPGVGGCIDETIRQILLFKRNYKKLFNRTIMENKPRVGLEGGVCMGASPEDINRIVTEGEVGFCLDIGHAIYYSSWSKLRYENVIEDFVSMKPDVYHLSDGDISSEVDVHLRLGTGNFDLGWIIKQIPQSSYITIETGNNSKRVMEDFEREVDCFNKFSVPAVVSSASTNL